MQQRNVIASFRDYDDANAAASELSRAGLGDVQIRVLPPRTTYGRYQGQQIVVSAIVNLDHAHRAEQILALNGGAIDLHEDANWGGDRWDERRGGVRAAHDQRPERFGKRRQAPQHHYPRHERSSAALPWGAIAGAAVALASGLALMRGAQEWFGRTQQDYAPGALRGRHFPAGRFQSNLEYQSPSQSSSYPDGENMRRSMGAGRRSSASSQSADDAELTWGDREADDTARLYDRPAGGGVFQTGNPVRAPSNQGFGSGQNAASNDGGAPQVGIGSGAGLTPGLTASPGANLGAGSATGRGSGLGEGASHGRDQAGTAATPFARS